MRRIYYICIYILLGVGIASCADNLDSDKYFKDRMLLEDVFTDETRTERWLAHAFSYLSGENMDVSSKDNNLFCFADDIYFGDRDDYKTFKNGTYNEGFRHSWGASYKGIRQASIFIQNVDMNMKITEQEKADFKAQARFVRATGFYFVGMVLYLCCRTKDLITLIVMKVWHGNAILMTNVPTTLLPKWL